MMFGQYEAPEPVTREQMQEIDRRAIEGLGIPGVVLMENAGAAVARAAIEICQSRSLDSISIVAGKGNNGGDGFVAARHIHNLREESEVDIYYVGSLEEDRGQGEAGMNLELLESFDLSIREVDPADAEQWLPEPESSTLLIDALFGTGISEDVREPYDQLIKQINEGLYPVLSVDIPSGLDANTGQPLGVSIEAYLTVTFGAAKKGLLEDCARTYVGALQVVDIQIPRKLIERA